MVDAVGLAMFLRHVFVITLLLAFSLSVSHRTADSSAYVEAVTGETQKSTALGIQETKETGEKRGAKKQHASMSTRRILMYVCTGEWMLKYAQDRGGAGTSGEEQLQNKKSHARISNICKDRDQHRVSCGVYLQSDWELRPPGTSSSYEPPSAPRLGTSPSRCHRPFSP